TPQSAALRSLFFATTEMKREQSSAAAILPIKRLGILGGGLLGGGIASVAAIQAGLQVRIKDIQSAGVHHELKYSWELLSRKVKRRHITAAEREREVARITGGTDYRGFAACDLVIEAVFENLSLKQQMVQETEQHAAAHTI